MRRVLVVSIAFAAIFAGKSFAYIGSLEADGGGLNGTGFWVTDNGNQNWFPAALSWEVTQNVDQTWHYEYTLNVFQADVSHFLLETSPSFGSSNLIDPVYPGTSFEIHSFTEQNGNPYMPGGAYGVKFEIGDEAVAEPQYTNITISFDSDRDPVWGDFYAKCGAVGGTQNTVWNEGFLDADPLAGPGDGSVLNHVLVPDTVPEPATALLMCLGGLALLRKRR